MRCVLWVESGLTSVELFTKSDSFFPFFSFLLVYGSVSAAFLRGLALLPGCQALTHKMTYSFIFSIHPSN